ncbi:MAG TPA: S8 family serine peptidase [Candidatus Binatia bacterium]|nr:S8 family serine peptidase [Candidatus Binatia bacterium]
MGSRVAFALSAVALSFGLATAAAAGPVRPAHPALAEKGRLASPWTKVARALRETVDAGQPVDLLRGALPARADGRLRVTVHVASLTAEQSAALRTAGLEVTFESALYRFVEGWAAPAALEALGGLDFVKAIKPTFAPITNVGSVTSQGDAILRADQARQEFGVTGQGIKVGVLSDSVDGIGTAIGSGDLPNDVDVIQAGTGAGEGTAMLEIVHDLAPGAALGFYGPSTSGDMITGINALAGAGARVIVDDLTFFDQPHFEEGPVAQAVNALAAQGVVYATSSGNFASATADRGHYEADYVDGGSAGGPVTHAHAFGIGVNAQSIRLLPNSRPIILLQWADQFGASGNDYDLYVSDGVNIIGTSDDVQNGDDFPFEAIAFNTTGQPGPIDVFVLVNRFSGSPRRLELYYAGGVTQINPSTPGGSIAGHANASGAITVATINAGDPGNDTIAPYSSQGPCDLFFPAVEVRNKPDVTGIDGVAVTGAAGFPNPFFGTSAAAPHIAGIAALLLDANPALTAPQVKLALQSTADDLGMAGFDFVFGSGRVDARDAVATAGTIGGALPQITSLVAHLDGDTVTLDVTAVDLDGDINGWIAKAYDAAGTPVGDTGLVDFDQSGRVNATFRLSVTGFSNLPTAVRIGLSLRDAGQHLSPEVQADFSQADAGGPVISSAAYRRGAKKLKLTGSGLVRRGTTLEVNGTLGKSVKVNKSGSKGTAKGGPARLNLRSGPNRVRVIANGLASNIAIVNR